MFDKSQLMRGTLEGSILKIISLEVTYGYKIMEELIKYGFEDIKEGTIYPLLVRLEKKGLILSELRESSKGPKRKYYEITKEGLETLDEFEDYFNKVSRTVNIILNLEGK